MKQLLGYLMTVVAFSNVSAQKDFFACDTTINGVIKLRNSISESFIHERTPLKKDNAFKIYILCNKPKTEYLLMYKYPGDSKDIFSRFEVGLTRLATFEMHSATKLAFDQLGTEGGIKLGMNKETIVSLKGNQFTMGKEKSMITLTYRLNDIKSDFLRRYNMPGYTEKFFLNNNKLVKFSIGFDNE